MRRTIPLLAATLFLAATGASRATSPIREPGCATPRAGADYTRHVEHVLASGRDVWGERLLRMRNGPTLEAASRFLPPLYYAAGHAGTLLTQSGAYYLPFTLPVSVGGSRGFGLHVADGSEILVRRVGGPRLSVAVGSRGDERFGSCLERLQSPRLAEGFLPILQVKYRDAAGVRYQEESFVGRLPGERSLVSFVRIAADASRATRTATIRLSSSTGGSLHVIVPRGSAAELDAAFEHSGALLHAVDADGYSSARSAVIAFWQRSLVRMPVFEVPEPAVMNAERGLLIQELELTWRYSIGNVYEELSYAEALDVAQVMTAYGCGDVGRQILRFTLRRLPVRFTNWRAGERLVAGAQYFRLTGDRRYVTEEARGLAAVVDRLEGELARSTNGLLPRERYSSDIADQIYSLQGQTLVWQGLLAMSRVWAETGHTDLAARARRLGVRLESGLRRAVGASERRLPDGSLFVPAGLLDGGSPFTQLTSSRAGTYWNLVAPYALASGFFAPHGGEAVGLLRYLELHGSRLLGLVRAGAYRLAGAGSGTPVSGTDEVYGINVARFLADMDEPDQLDLSLYGTLAGALTPGTFVAGEAASVMPLRSRRYRTMYLPPNNDAAATYLETLRLTLVHETRDAEGRPNGLELAFATPRAWLADGKSIRVQDAPTSFGPVSFAIARHGDLIEIAVDPPRSHALRSLRLRLRLPAGLRLVRLTGAETRLDPTSDTVDLPTGGPLALVATVGER